MNNKSNILFVCGKNISRSKTAEQIFRQDTRFKVKSAGLSPKSPHQISQLDIDRADIIFVMEQSHKKQIIQQYDTPSDIIQVMDIEDIYEYMDEELIGLLHQGIDSFITGL